MMASFSKKHALLLIIVLAVVALVFLIARFKQDQPEPKGIGTDAPINLKAATGDYQKEVTSIISGRVQGIDQTTTTADLLKEVEQLQKELQEKKISRENQDIHLQLVLKLALIKQALQKSNLELADQLLEEFKQIQ